MKAGTFALWAIVLYWAMPYLIFSVLTFFYLSLFAIGAI